MSELIFFSFPGGRVWLHAAGVLAGRNGRRHGVLQLLCYAKTPCKYEERINSLTSGRCGCQGVCQLATSVGDTVLVSWWRHQMETFSALLAICAGNSPVPGEFPAQRPVTRSFDIFFDLCPNKRLSKQWWGWWFETPSCSLWRQCNDCVIYSSLKCED